MRREEGRGREGRREVGKDKGGEVRKSEEGGRERERGKEGRKGTDGREERERKKEGGRDEKR